MRRLSRLDKSIDLLRPRSRTPVPASSPFLCSSCRRHARSPFSTSTSRLARKGLSTEGLRKRIWGTDTPPGPEDPYNASSPMNKPKTAKQLAEESEDLEYAASETKAPAVDMTNYEPAATWEGLVEVGEETEEEFMFQGFLPRETITDPYEATAALHRAVVEAFTLQNVGRPLQDLAKAGRGVDVTSGVQISVPRSKAAQPILDFSAGASEEDVLESLNRSQRQADSFQAEEVEESAVIDVKAADNEVVGDSIETFEGVQFTPYQHQVASWDPSWLSISLEDPLIKFAVLKRTTQLTGILIPDSTIRSIRTVHSLLEHITKKPEAKKLAEALVQKNELVNLPNVKIWERRVTPIDREVQVGRWKVIEAELERRGLPVTGHGH